jgi:hypothetical protein
MVIVTGAVESAALGALEAPVPDVDDEQAANPNARTSAPTVATTRFINLSLAECVS